MAAPAYAFTRVRGAVESGPEGTSAFKFLGTLPHAELLRLVRDSLAVVYPRGSFQENYPATYVEANSLGTPVLTNFPVRGDPTYELLTPEQVLRHAAQPQEYVERLAKWALHGARPRVDASRYPRSEDILIRWERLLRLDHNSTGTRCGSFLQPLLRAIGLCA